MYDHILDEAERILEQDPDIIVPVKKIWVEVRQIAEDNDWLMPTLTEFSSLLMQDDRFEFLPDQESMGMVEELADDERVDEEMEVERFGFYGGQRVKLARVQLTPERLGGLIRRKVDDTMDALTKAWEERPEGDAETEGALFGVLSEAKKLQRDVKETFSEENMKSLGEAMAGAQSKESPKGKRRLGVKKSSRKTRASARPKAPRGTSSSNRKPSSRKKKR